MFNRDPCRKGHRWQYYGWSVMGFGPYRYHDICSKCGLVVTRPETPDEEEDEEEDGPK